MRGASQPSMGKLKVVRVHESRLLLVCQKCKSDSDSSLWKKVKKLKPDILCLKKEN